MVIVLLKESSAFTFKIKQMRALHSFEVPRNYQFTRRNIQEELNHPEHQCENSRIPIFLYFNLHFLRISLSFLYSFALYICLLISSLSFFFFFSLLLGAECNHFASDPFLLSVTSKLWQITTHTNFGVTHRTNFYLAFVVIRTCIRKQRLGKFVFVLKNKRQRATLVQTQSVSERWDTCNYTQRKIQCTARRSIWASVNHLISG
jgi:hypothetical protein